MATRLEDIKEINYLLNLNEYYPEEESDSKRKSRLEKMRRSFHTDMTLINSDKKQKTENYSFGQDLAITINFDNSKAFVKIIRTNRNNPITRFPLIEISYLLTGEYVTKRESFQIKNFY